MKKDKIILLISFIIFLLLLVLSFSIVNNLPLTFNIVFISILVLFVPYMTYKFLEFRKIKYYEKAFPNFLRDVAESLRAGLTMKQAIETAAKSEYGVLTPEIRRMERQLGWSSLDVVLNTFANRMSHSKLIKRSVLVMIQSNKSGEDIETSMEKLATNLELIKEVRDEKATNVNQHVMMMYGIFLIFLGISIILIKFLVPVLETQLVSGGSLISTGDFNPNPCYKCISSDEIGCLNCKMFFGVSTVMSFGNIKDSGTYYRSIFFIMIMIQGFFSGVIAGQISGDSIIAGMKHSAIMLVFGIFIFVSAVRFGFI